MSPLPKTVLQPDIYKEAFEAQPYPGFFVSGIPIRNARFVQVLLAFPGGASIESSTEYGFAELVATLLSRGAGPWDRQQFALECDRRGVSLQIAAYYDLFIIELSVLPEDLSWGIELLSHLVYRPHFLESEIAIAVREHCEQILARPHEQRPALSDLGRAKLFAAQHAYSRPLCGSFSTVEAANKDSLEKFYKRLLLADSPAYLCLAGAFRKDSLLTRLEKNFLARASGKQQAVVPLQNSSLFALKPARFSQIEFPTPQNRVLIGLPAVGRRHPKYVEYSLANEIFGGAFHSRLTRAIRSKEGLAYSASSHLWAGFQGGCLWISLQTDRDNLSKALGTVRVTMEELLKDGLEPEEVEHFRQFVESSLTFEYDSLSGLTSRLLEALLFDEPWLPQERRLILGRAAKAPALAQALEDILAPERAVVCLSGNLVADKVGKVFFRKPTLSQLKSFSAKALLWQPKAPAVPTKGRRPIQVADSEQAKLLRYPNGLHLLFLPRPEYLSISLQVWTCTGAMDEPKGKSGLSHLLEHLMFRGTLNVADGDFDSILAAKGGINNAFTSEDFTVYTDYVVAGGLEDALALEADRFVNLKVTKEIFTTERDVVLEERSLRVDSNPLGKVFEQLQKTAFLDHPYGWPVLGWRDDVLGLSLEELMAHYKAAVRPEKLLVVIAGGCELETASKLVGQTFATYLEASDKGERVPVWPVLASNTAVPPLSPQTLRFEERSGYSYLLAAFRFPREGHPDYEAAELISRILGQGDSSYLHDHFVRGEEWALETWVSYEPQTRDHPLFHLGLAVVTDFEFDFRKEQLSSFLRGFPARLQQDDLDKARRGWLAEDAFGTDELEDWALEVAGRVMLLEWDKVWGIEERILGVSLDDIKRVSASYLTPDQAIFAHLKASSSL